MDNLVLIRVAAALRDTYGRALIREVREESASRLRILVETEPRAGSIVVSLSPEQPWIGAPAGRWEGPRRAPGPFAALCAKALGGTALRGIDQLGCDRVVALRCADGSALVVELATHGANLVLLDVAGRVTATARRPRSSQSRLHPGASYEPPPLPRGKLAPFGAAPDEIDAFLLERARETGDPPFEILRRGVFGVGTEGAHLVLAESALSGATPGSVLAARLKQLEEGSIDPVIVGHVEDLLAAADAGTLEEGAIRLLPWPPRDPEAGCVSIREDAAATAGYFHDCLERAASIRARGDALGAILAAEIERTRSAERRIEEDAAGRYDPDRHRIWGEAILAGLSVARRAGNHVIVPDPYDPEANDLVVPGDPGRSLTTVAEDHFRRHRKARRGIEAVEARLAALRARGDRLDALAAASPDARSAEGAARLAEGMRAEGIAVALEPRTRAGRAAARAAPPRLEGIRLYTSADGAEILVGRTGRDNDRLTFRLAGPDDFWLHATGTAGAHVILRNPRRGARPSPEALRHAAGLAAWWSDARASSEVAVQWTRRKHVHRLRGAAPGTVKVKKSESIVVRPSLPSKDLSEP